MAQAGLLALTRIAPQAWQAALPSYRSRFSKHHFAQPQLLATLGRMRYEDWTFREAEMRLDSQRIDRAVNETVRRLRAAHKKRRRRVRVGVDSTGLALGAVSTVFVRRMYHHWQKSLPRRHWLKRVILADLDQQFPLSEIARHGPWNDCVQVPVLVKKYTAEYTMAMVSSDSEVDSERNHSYMRQLLWAQSTIPPKRGKKTKLVRGVRAKMRRAFP